MYSSPSKTAVVCWPDASVPALGSVRPNAPNFSPLASGLKNFCFCSSLPYWYIGHEPRDVWADNITPVVPQTLDNSSTAIIYPTVSPPSPPYSFGYGIPIIPAFAIFSTVS